MVIKTTVNPLLLLLLLSLGACENAIKNESAEVIVEKGTQIGEQDTSTKQAPVPKPKTQINHDSVMGYWVGYFEPRGEDANPDKHVEGDANLYWNRQNKINISIDSIIGDSVVGHSVVAGNDRPFHGHLEDSSGILSFELKEPGDDRYDGVFRFTIRNGSLTGKWDAYRNINISKRKYTLLKKDYAYHPEQMLTEYARRFGNWNKRIEEQGVDTVTYKDKEGKQKTERIEWFARTFATATDAVYQINASTDTLTKAHVENLSSGDLLVIRNTIYARHGYSFKNRPLRVFFDAQPWYIPVHADIRQAFTELEKQNIKLLLRYEQHAQTYYDSFGRG